MRRAGFFGALLAAVALAAVTIVSAASDTAPTESVTKTQAILGPCTTGC